MTAEERMKNPTPTPLPDKRIDRIERPGNWPPPPPPPTDPKKQVPTRERETAERREYAEE